MHRSNASTEAVRQIELRGRKDGWLYLHSYTARYLPEVAVESCADHLDHEEHNAMIVDYTYVDLMAGTNYNLVVEAWQMSF
jgi:hypothetical protein